MDEENKNTGLASLTYEAGKTAIKVWVDSEKGVAWMTQKEMAKLYGTTKQNVSRRLKAIASKMVTVDKPVNTLLTGHANKGRFKTNLYGLDEILAIGEGMHSRNGLALKEWLENRLKNEPEKMPIIRAFSIGNLSIDVQVSPEEDTVWITQNQIALLFEKTVQTISHHVAGILSDGELDDSVIKYYLNTGTDGKAYRTAFYNLDMILAIGYRVRSKRATEFRRWASKILKSYLRDGFAIDEDRLLSAEGSIGQLAAKVVDLESKQKETNRAFEERLSALEKKEEEEKVFFEGEFHRVKDFFLHLFEKADTRIVIIDPYADKEILLLLGIKKEAVPVYLLRGPKSQLRLKEKEAFNLLVGGLQSKKTDAFHDRFLLIDGEIYHVGASINHAGQKIFAVMKMHDPKSIQGISERVDSLIED